MMNLTHYIDLRRLGLLMRNTISLKRRSIRTMLYTLTCFMILINLIAPPTMRDFNYYPGLFLWLYFMIGLWFSSRIFSPVHDAQKGVSFFMLPCSTLEKFLNGFLLLTVGYTLLATLFFYVLSVITWLAGRYIFHYYQPIFNPFDFYILKYIGAYCIIQSVLMLGSVVFRSHVVTKTLFVIFLLAILFLVISFLATLLLGHVLTTSIVMGLSLSALLKMVAGYFFWIGLAPLCWIVTFFKLKECEI